MVEIRVTDIDKDEDANAAYIRADVIADGVKVGAVAITTDYDVENTNGAYIERIDIDDEYQNCGIGTATLKEISYTYGGAYAAPDNADAQRLYARLGDDISETDSIYAYCDQGFGVYSI